VRLPSIPITNRPQILPMRKWGRDEFSEFDDFGIIRWECYL